MWSDCCARCFWIFYFVSLPGAGSPDRQIARRFFICVTRIVRIFTSSYCFAEVFVDAQTSIILRFGGLTSFFIPVVFQMDVLDALSSRSLSLILFFHCPFLFPAFCRLAGGIVCLTTSMYIDFFLLLSDVYLCWLVKVNSPLFGV